MGRTTASIADIDKIAGLKSQAKDIDGIVKGIDTVADFKAMTDTPKRVHVSGYHEKDGGEFGSNFFILRDGVVPNGSYNNGGTVVETTAGVYDLAFDGVAKPEYFGLSGIKYDTIRKFGLLYKSEQLGVEPTELMKEYGATPDDGWSTNEHLINGTKYYISNSTGDDNNDGLSPSTAFKTLAKARDKIAFTADASILLKRGDVWSGDDAVFGNAFNITGTEDSLKVITCYGIGNLPLIDSLKEHSVTWTTENTLSYFIPNINPNRKIPSLVINGTARLSSLTLQDLIDKTNGEEYYHDTSSGKVYTNLDTTKIQTIEYSDNDKCIELAGSTNYANISYLNIRNNRVFNINTYYTTLKNTTIENCTLGANTYRAIQMNTLGISIKNCIIDANTPDLHKYIKSSHTCEGFEGVVVNVPDGAIGDFTIRNCSMKDFRHANVIINYLGTNTEAEALTTANVSIEKNLFYLSDSIQYGGAFSLQGMINNVKLKDNFFRRTKGSQILGIDLEISDNVFWKTQNAKLTSKAVNIGRSIQTVVFDGTSIKNANINNNIAFKGDGDFVSVDGNMHGKVDGTNIVSNIMYKCGQDFMQYEGSSFSGVQMRIRLADTYKPTNTKVIKNIIFSDYKNHAIFYGDDAFANTEDNYYSVKDFENKVFTDGTVAKNNLQIDPSIFIEKLT